MGEIVYLEKPNLHKPYLIIGFEGWPNAAEISSSAIHYLIENLDAKKFASISMENFYQTSSARPEAIIKEGKLIELKFTGNNFYYSKNPLYNDLVLFYGIEPHLRWDLFADLLLNLAEQFGVSQIFTIGGTYDYIPHTFPPMVSAVFNDENLREKVIHAGLSLTEYSGPISIHTFILEGARKRGLKVISLWGHAPQYLQTKNVRVVHSVLQRLMKLTTLKVDLAELEKASTYFDQQVNHLVQQDSKLQEVISKLEEIYKQTEVLTPTIKKEGLTDEKVIYIQAFLKKQEDEEKNEG